MSDLKIRWDPRGITVDTLSNIKFLHASDGDTPNISLSVRMLSVDAPEKHYPGNAKPSNYDSKLLQLSRWIADKKAPISEGLGAYLYSRLATGSAGTLQLQQGEAAEAFFMRLINAFLKKESGGIRSLFIRTADETFDSYGRLLAYIAPKYTKAELAAMNRWQRSTFNLMMVRGGWGSSFMIYPSLPSFEDMEMMQQAAREAFIERRGFNANPLSLAGYEFRMVVRLYDLTRRLVDGEILTPAEKRSWISRYCVDISTAEMFSPEDYYKVAPYNRLFIWPADREEAIEKLGLTVI